MTHFGENIEIVEDDPVNLMLPSDSTKTVSILNYQLPKLKSYEKFTSINFKGEKGSLDLASPRSFHLTKEITDILNQANIGHWN